VRLAKPKWYKNTGKEKAQQLTDNTGNSHHK